MSMAYNNTLNPCDNRPTNDFFVFMTVEFLVSAFPTTAIVLQGYTA